MMQQSYFRRGQPLLVVIIVLTLWSGARAALGQVPPAMAQSWRAVNLSAAGQLWDRMWTLKAAELLPTTPSSSPATLISRGTGRPALIAAGNSASPGSDREAADATLIQTGPAEEVQSDVASALVVPDAGDAARKGVVSSDAVSVSAPGGVPVNPTYAARTPKPRYRRTADGWVYVRGGASTNGPVGGTVASYAGYGGSQAGAVLRYALGRSKHDPTAFLRMSGSLGSGMGSYRETAAGISVRPLPSFPVSVMAELRSQQSAAGLTLRPAATVVTHIAPQKLPNEFQAELYGQAGYVAGKGATAFYDGQAVVDRPMGVVGKSGSLRAGAAVWAGGQAGASRVDLGPTASARLPAGRATVRVSVDWRFRVAGNAQPGSGLAATVAAGF